MELWKEMKASDVPIAEQIWFASFMQHLYYFEILLFQDR